MFSRLSKGYGSWTAGFVDPYYGEQKDREHTFPEIDAESHVHGVTVNSHSGRSTSLSYLTKRSREPTSDPMHLPKTYSTKRGALQLYVAPDDEEEEEEEDENLSLQTKYVQIKRPAGQELIDLSLKLGTMDRLAMSILQFGDQEFDHDHASISDAKNKAFLKFLHSVGGKQQGIKDPSVDTTVQPGGDLTGYLRDLKNSAASMKYSRDGSMYIPKSRESMELQAILRGLDTSTGWPMSFQQDMFDKQSSGLFTRPVSRVSSRGPSPGPPSTPRSTYQVLSSKKLAASIKSGSYMGRPSSRLSVEDDEQSDGELGVGGPQPVTAASVTMKGWSPIDSTDNLLLDTREKFYRGSVASGSIAEEDSDSDEGKKRRRLRERSFLTGSDLLYQGRNARKVEGQREGDLKVTNKGEGQTQGKGQGNGMGQIEEEHGGSNTTSKKTSGNASLAEGNENYTEDSESVVWAKQVADVQRKTTEVETIQIKESDVAGTDLTDNDIEKNTVSILAPQRLLSRPSSHVSDSSTSSRSSPKPTPSVITLQTTNKPIRSLSAHHKYEDKYLPAHKRRKSISAAMLYDPERSKMAYMGGGRRTSDSNFKVKGKGHANELIGQGLDNDKSSLKMSGVSVKPTFGPGTLSWSSMTDHSTNDKVPDQPDGASSHGFNEFNEKQLEEVPEPVREKIRSESSHSGIDVKYMEDKVKDFVEHDAVIQDEDIIDDIEACNEEVEQIEARAEAVSVMESDSGTSLDLEQKVINVIVEDKVRDNSEDVEGQEVNMELEKGEEDEIAMENESHLDERPESGAPTVSTTESEVNVENDVEIEDQGEGQEMVSVDEVEVLQRGNVDDKVDEVNDEDLKSEGKSHRSSHKLRSRFSGDGESEEGTQDGGRNYLTEQADVHSIAGELDALGLRKPPVSSGKKKGKKEVKSYAVPPPGPRPKAPQEKGKIADHLLDAMKRRPSLSYQNMERDLEHMTNLVDESLSGPTLEAIGEGLTEEELEMAKQILQNKITEARDKLEGKDGKMTSAGKKKVAIKGIGKKGGKKKKEAQGDDRTEEEKERDAMREKQELEKKKRDMEAQELQRKIAERRKLLQAQDNLASAKSKEIREQMEQLEREADDLQRAEDEARSILSDVRKKQREEREARRKVDLERKRLEAQGRRDREKKELEDKRRKEMEMMELIADGEMRRRLKEEEERKMYEEERLAQEKYEEELREAQRFAEEEEERMKEMEREAEEEAMQRLIEEREDADRQRRRLMEEEEKMREAELLKREYMLEEERRLHEERMKIEEADNSRRELERQRLMELRQLEMDARNKMMEEVEQKRAETMARRDHNLENRVSVDKLRHYQGITRAWTFSYFIKWPRETYERHSRSRLKRGRPIGGGDPRKVVKINNPQPKKTVDPPPDGDSNNQPALP